MLDMIKAIVKWARVDDKAHDSQIVAVTNNLWLLGGVCRIAPTPIDP
jgi:hypothetical protein